MLTVIEEANDFDNSHMFRDDELTAFPDYQKQHFENCNSLLYTMSNASYTTKLKHQSSAPNAQQQEPESVRELEESTYNSFLNLFDSDKLVTNNSQSYSHNINSYNSHNSYSNYNSFDRSPSKAPSLSNDSTISVPSRYSSISSPNRDKHYSTSTVSTDSNATATSGSTFSHRFSLRPQIIYKPSGMFSRSKKKVVAIAQEVDVDEVSVNEPEEDNWDQTDRSAINLDFYDLTSEDYNGVPFNFSLLFDKVVMIVNVASFCGFTKQYDELERLYEKYNSKGFEIIAFPSNQFLQEPKSETEIVQFCSLRFNVSFPIMKKIRVNGKKSSPIYDYLKKQKPGAFKAKRVLWNFEKFIVDKRGNVVDRATAFKKPKEFEDMIVKLLEE